MKAQLPRLRKRLNQDPDYFKKVYGHAFVMSLQPGARVLALDSGEFDHGHRREPELKLTKLYHCSNLVLAGLLPTRIGFETLGALAYQS
jgi:hypothetical protein